MRSAHYTDNVFINCPFDPAYKPLFDAMVFTIHDCGFIARCALEEEDSTQARIDQIYNIITDCCYGIHDISRIELDETSGFPRFNMPLELGIFLGAKQFGVADQKEKKGLVLDKEPHRYQQFISDIAGQDIQAHSNDVETIVRVVRNWLRTASGRQMIPGGGIICRHYQEFLKDLPRTAERFQLEVEYMIFNDYTLVVEEWLKNRDD